MTTDLGVARAFAGENGIVMTARLPTCKLIPQTLKGSTESELLILHSAGGFR